MKKFIKNNWEYLLIGIIGIFVIGAFSLGVNFKNSRADSGWDSDYDSGGGWSSSDSWSGGDSWSSSDWSSSDWSSSNGYSGGNSSLATTIIVWIIIIAIIVALNNTSDNKSSIYESKTKGLVMRADISEDEVKKILPDETLESLKKMAYERFIDIQNAWMDFDYDKLKVLCTDELFNTYQSQLDVLSVKNGKNIMTAFDQEEIKIISIKKTKDMVTVGVYLRVTFFDYVIHNQTKEVMRGTKEYPLTNNYEMQFVKSLKQKEIKCPNCGALVKTVTATKCEYCGSTIVVDALDYVLSKKTNVNK